MKHAIIFVSLLLFSIAYSAKLSVKHTLAADPKDTKAKADVKSVQKQSENVTPKFSNIVYRKAVELIQMQKSEPADNSKTNDCPIQFILSKAQLEMFEKTFPKKHKACNDFWGKNNGLGGSDTMKSFADFDNEILKAEQEKKASERCKEEDIEQFANSITPPDVSKDEAQAIQKNIIANVDKLFPKSLKYCQEQKIASEAPKRVEAKTEDKKKIQAKTECKKNNTKAAKRFSNPVYRTIVELVAKDKSQPKDDSKTEDCPIRFILTNSLLESFQKTLPNKYKACEGLWGKNGGIGGDEVMKSFYDFDKEIVKQEQASKEKCKNADLEEFANQLAPADASKDEHKTIVDKIVANIDKFFPKTWAYCQAQGASKPKFRTEVKAEKVAAKTNEKKAKKEEVKAEATTSNTTANSNTNANAKEEMNEESQASEENSKDSSVAMAGTTSTSTSTSNSETSAAKDTSNTKKPVLPNHPVPPPKN